MLVSVSTLMDRKLSDNGYMEWRVSQVLAEPQRTGDWWVWSKRVKTCFVCSILPLLSAAWKWMRTWWKTEETMACKDSTEWKAKEML